MKTIQILALCWGLALAASPPDLQAATLRPLQLQDARLLAKDKGELRLGFSYANDEYSFFQTEDRDRRLWQVPLVEINTGLGERVEWQLAYSYLHLREDGQKSRWGSGDLELGFKIRLLQPPPAWPDLALRIAVKLPNADNTADLGTDQTDTFVDLLTSRRWGRIGVHLNLGLAILGDPRPERDGQDDLLRYAFGCEFPLPGQGSFLLGVDGLFTGRSLNERGQARAGFRIPLGKLTWDVGGGVGYLSRSADWRIETGLTHRFQLPAWAF